MSHPQPIEKRLCDEPAAQASPAAALLRRLPPLPPASPAALLRVEARLPSAAPSRWPLRAPWLLVPAAAALFLVPALHRRPPPPRPPLALALAPPALRPAPAPARGPARAPAPYPLRIPALPAALRAEAMLLLPASALVHAAQVAAFSGATLLGWQGEGAALVVPPPEATRPSHGSLVRTRPAGVSAPAAPAAEPPLAETRLQTESRVLGAALRALRQEHDAAAALRLLDDHRGQFPDGALVPEATAARVDALLVLGRRAEALALLRGMSLMGLSRAAELRVLRGELLLEAGHPAEALADFSTVLGADTLQDAVVERALYGRASGRAKSGDSAGARRDLEAYLARFPAGRFADAARESLGK